MHGRQFGDAAIGSKDHTEGNMHWRDVEIGVREAPAIAVAQPPMEALHLLRLGQSNVALPRHIVQPVKPVSIPRSADRRDIVVDGISVVRKFRPRREEVAICRRVKHFRQRRANLDRVMNPARSLHAVPDRGHDGHRR